MKTISKRAAIILLCLTAFVIMAVWQGIAVHRYLAQLQKSMAGAWSDANKEYQFRAELVSKLVDSASTTPNFDQAAISALKTAQAEAATLHFNPNSLPSNPGEVSDYDKAETAVEKAVFHVIAVPLIHHDVKVTNDFRNLSGQLMNLQTNLALARNRYNGAVQTYDQTIAKFPGVFYAPLFGCREQALFSLDPANGSNVASATAGAHD